MDNDLITLIHDYYNIFENESDTDTYEYISFEDLEVPKFLTLCIPRQWNVDSEDPFSFVMKNKTINVRNYSNVIEYNDVNLSTYPFMIDNPSYDRCMIIDTEKFIQNHPEYKIIPTLYTGMKDMSYDHSIDENHEKYMKVITDEGWKKIKVDDISDKIPSMEYKKASGFIESEKEWVINARAYPKDYGEYFKEFPKSSMIKDDWLYTSYNYRDITFLEEDIFAYIVKKDDDANSCENILRHFDAEKHDNIKDKLLEIQADEENKLIEKISYLCEF